MLTRRRVLALVAILAGLSIVLSGLGCGEDGVTDPDGTDGCELDVDSILQVAGDSLGVLMVEMVQQTIENADSSFRPNDIDFTGVHSIYSAALNCEPDNNDARFGAAFTGLMSFMADESFNDLYERIKQAVDSQITAVSGQIPQMDMGGEAMPGGIPLTPGGLNRSIFDPLRFNNRLTAAASADPAISELQQVFETRLLPMVAEARGHLVNIIAGPSYEFTLTPAMQGDPGAYTIYLDRSDFRVFLASACLFESATHIFLSRDLDFDSYDIEGVFEAARQESSFLDLRSGDHMPAAKTRLLSARAELVNAIDDLLAEYNSGENQDDDLIRVAAGDIDDLNEIRDSLVSFGTYFEGSHDIEIVYNEDCWYQWNGMWYERHCTEDTMSLTVDISEFFDNPVSNPKSLIPGYTLTIDTVTVDLYYVCYDWDAATFDEWVWPNPTVNGLFPDLTADSLNTLLHWDANRWLPAECDTLDLR